METPDLALLVITYNRKDILRQTLRGLMKNIRHTGNIGIFVTDDGSHDGTQAMIRAEFPMVNLIQNNRVGLGANTNAGLQECWGYSPYVLQLQDDMLLKEPLNVSRHINKLMMDETSGYIRLWGISGHRYRATLDDQSPELGRWYSAYWRIDWYGDELYIASDRPHLKHKRFHNQYGMYPTGLPTAATEEVWCKQTKGAVKPGGVDVLCPHAEQTESNWEHMGWEVRWRDKGL